MEFIQQCLALPTLPFTLLLGVVFAYWSLVIVGFIGLDVLELDFDLDADVDLDLDADIDVDLNVDVDVDLDVDADVDADLDGVSTGGSAWLSLLRFMNLGEVPTMIVGSVCIFCLWTFSLLLNSRWNPAQSIGLGALLTLPNLLITPISTRLLTAPFRQVFKRANAGIAAPTKIVGKTVIVTTGEVTGKFGQAELITDTVGAAGPITLNVRTRDGQALGKGDEALVVEHDANADTYLVVPYELGVN